MLGLASISLSDVPDVAVAPVIDPVLVPSVQAYVLAIPEVRAKAGLEPLHVLAVVALVNVGLGFTVIVTAVTLEGQDPVVEVAVTL